MNVACALTSLIPCVFPIPLVWVTVVWYVQAGPWDLTGENESVPWGHN